MSPCNLLCCFNLCRSPGVTGWGSRAAPDDSLSMAFWHRTTLLSQVLKSPGVKGLSVLTPLPHAELEEVQDHQQAATLTSIFLGTRDSSGPGPRSQAVAREDQPGPRQACGEVVNHSAEAWGRRGRTRGLSGRLGARGAPRQHYIPRVGGLPARPSRGPAEPYKQPRWEGG